MVKSIVPPGSGAARLHATGSGRGGGHPDTRTDPELISRAHFFFVFTKGSGFFSSSIFFQKNKKKGKKGKKDKDLTVDR